MLIMKIDLRGEIQMPDENDPYELSDPLLAILKERGVQLEEPREIDHCFFCKDAETVNKLYEEVSKLGLELAGGDFEENEFIDEGEYALTVKETARPDQMSDRQEQLEELAEKFECSYDGWGSAI